MNVEVPAGIAPKDPKPLNKFRQVITHILMMDSCIPYRQWCGVLKVFVWFPIFASMELWHHVLEARMALRVAFQPTHVLGYAHLAIIALQVALHPSSLLVEMLQCFAEKQVLFQHSLI